MGMAKMLPVQFKYVGNPTGLWDKPCFFFDLFLDHFVSVHKDESYLISTEKHRVEEHQSGVGNALPGVPSQDSTTGQASTGPLVTLETELANDKVSAATPLPVQAGSLGTMPVEVSLKSSIPIPNYKTY